MMLKARVLLRRILIKSAVRGITVVPARLISKDDLRASDPRKLARTYCFDLSFTSFLGAACSFLITSLCVQA